MKTIKISLGLIAVMVASVAFSSFVFAEEGVSGAVNLGIGSALHENEGNKDATTSVDVDVHAKNNDEASTTHDENDQNNTDIHATSSQKENGEGNENEHEITSDSHGAVVSAFVKNLLAVALREGGIGSQVRVIAQEQDDSSAKVSTAITHIEHKGGFSSFFFGTDYANIGVLRNEMVKTSAEIVQLQALVEKTTDATDKATLNAQIKLLQDEQVKIQAFINLHEGKFSLFGWFVKMFNK